ncbi:MAG TPA: NAD(P)/FAD-dependent oxidoreductase [Thermoplasmata archaeon]|nr:NAD(P)/FAD-dependent oxidoreductase [Thermoplasmata archaeon]
MPGFPRLRDAYDIVVAGGGHAGLQAGLKTALLHHTAAVIDRGPKFSRSYYAPKMENIPGYPDGISGHALLDKQIAALGPWSEQIGYFTPGRVVRATRTEGGFEVHFEWLKQSLVARGRALILALGVVDRMPVVGGKIDPIFPWANFGIVDFCVFCDGHDLTGRSVGVLGSDRFAVETAIDLLHYEPKSVELLTHGEPLLGRETPEERDRWKAELEARHIGWNIGTIVGFDGIREKRWIVKFADGTTAEYDRGFSGLGWYDLHQEIPRSLGARFDNDGFVETDEDCRVLAESTGEPIPGLYCVGDLRNGWNQIPEAWATAERAVIHAYGYYL